MADPAPKVKLGLSPEGFIEGLRRLEQEHKRTTSRMGASMTGVLSKQIKADVASATSHLKKLHEGVKRAMTFPDESFARAMVGVERAGLATANKLRGAFDRVFMGFVGRGLQAQQTATGWRWTMKDKGGGGGAGGGGGMSAAAFGGIMVARDALQQAFGKGMDLVHEVGATEESAMRLSIAARGAGEKYVDPKLLEHEFYAASTGVKGTTSEEAAGAAAKFVQMTGDLDTARKSLTTFAHAARATGGDMSDIAGTTAAISQQFGVTDPEEIKDVLASLAYQGKKGAFELKDAASLFPRLLAAGAGLGMKKDSSSVKTLGGLIQVGRTSTGSGEQAATMMEGMLSDLKAKSAQLKGQGIKVYEGKGAQKHVRDLTELIPEIIAKVGKTNVSKKNEMLQKDFGEHVRVLNPMIAKFNDTVKASTKKTEKEKQAEGQAAVKKMIDEAIDAGGSWNDVMMDSARAQMTNSATMTAAWEQVKSVAADKLLPAFGQIAQGMSDGKFDHAIEGAITGLELLFDVLRDFADMAYSTGLIKKHKKTELEQRDDELVAAKKADEQLKKIATTPQQEAALRKSGKWGDVMERQMELTQERDKHLALASSHEKADRAKANVGATKRYSVEAGGFVDVGGNNSAEDSDTGVMRGSGANRFKLSDAEGKGAKDNELAAAVAAAASGSKDTAGVAKQQLAAQQRANELLARMAGMGAAPGAPAPGLVPTAGRK